MILAFDMTDHEAAQSKRDEMFRDWPYCAFCYTEIENKDHAAALHYNSDGRWELVHGGWGLPRCDMEAIMAENKRRETHELSPIAAEA